MWPIRIERFIEALIARLGAIQEAIQQHTTATNAANEASQKQWRQVRRVISTVVNSKNKVRTEYAKGQKKNGDHPEDRILRAQEDTAKWTKWAVFAAMVYGAVAWWQGCLTHGTLIQMQQQTQFAMANAHEAQNSVNTAMTQLDVTTRQMEAQTTAQVQAARASQTAAKAAQDAANVARDTLIMSEESEVTIGKSDGVIAEFIPPENQSDDNWHLVIYFQNTGHRPAAFHWGTVTKSPVPRPYGGTMETKDFGITYNHPFVGNLSRYKDPHTGRISENPHERVIIAGQSFYRADVGAVSRKAMDAYAAKSVAFIVVGNFEYCDEFGNYAFKEFDLRYRGLGPPSNVNFEVADEVDLQRPAYLQGTGYLFPCSTLSERKKQPKR
jgi:hypothetical protein